MTDIVVNVTTSTIVFTPNWLTESRRAIQRERAIREEEIYRNQNNMFVHQSIASAHTTNRRIIIIRCGELN